MTVDKRCREELLTDQKKSRLRNPPVVEPELFQLSGQNIWTTDFFADEIEGKVYESVENSRIIILNEDCFNAYAYHIHDVNVIAVSAGCLRRCLHAASLLMFSRYFFPDVGNLDACDDEGTADRYPLQIDEEGHISLSVSGDDDRCTIGFIIAALAVKYIVYHEVGHHLCGHMLRYIPPLCREPHHRHTPAERNSHQ